MSKTPLCFTKRTLFLGLVLLGGLLGTEGLADPPTHGPDFAFPVRELGTTSLGSPITRTVVGWFNNDGDPDIVMLRGGAPEMVIDPLLHSAALSYPSGAASPDIAKLPQLTSGIDELLTIEAGGLRAWKRTSTGFSSRTVGSSAWSGTEILRTASLSGTSRIDIVGYRDSDEHLVLLIDPDLAGETESSFEIARPALDIVPFVRYANGTVQLAVRTSLGVLVYALNGTFIESFSGPADGALAAIDLDGVAYQNLGWIHSDGSDQVLEIIENDGTDLTAATPITVDCGTVAAMIAADMDGSGDDDLVISHRDNFDLVVLPGNYSTQVSYEIRMGAPQEDASGNVTWPAVADFDNDGDTDVVFSNDEVSMHYVHRSSVEDETDLIPAILSVRYAYHEDEVQPAMLRIEFDDEETFPGSANYIEVLSWWKSPLNLGTDETVHRYLIDSTTLGSNPEVWLWLEETTDEGQLPGAYFWLARFVEVDDLLPGDPLVQTFPSRTYGFATAKIDDPSPAVNYLLGLPGTSAYRNVIVQGYEYVHAHIPSTYTFGTKSTTSTETDTDPIPDYDDETDPGEGSGGFNP